MPAATTISATSAYWVSISTARSGIRSPLAAHQRRRPRSARSLVLRWRRKRSPRPLPNCSRCMCASGTARTNASSTPCGVLVLNLSRNGSMRQIIRRREIVADELRYAGEPELDGTISVQTLAEWIAGAGCATAPAAVLLSASDEIETLAPHLQSVRWIVIEFAKPGDGRGFSQARMLRQRCGYPYELRARGVIKRDQLFFLARCGFDAFDLDPAEDLAACLPAFNTFSVAYQDGSDVLLSVRRRA